MGVKKHRGGKYPIAERNTGYFGNGNAGVAGEFIAKHYGVKREFIGSGMHEYNFYKEGAGILTINANSYEEALRQAKRRGYSSRNYMR